jgi:DNA-binding HxlR family transcriptional regulator
VLNRTYPDQDCSIARALEVVGERWTLLILRDAQLGKSSFHEFRDSLGIATNILSTRLDRLCAEGLLERTEDGRYEVTDKGRALSPVLITLMHWGDRFYPHPEGPPRLTLHRGCGGRVDATLRCAAFGQLVTFAEIAVEPGPALRADAPAP